MIEGGTAWSIPDLAVLYCFFAYGSDELKGEDFLQIKPLELLWFSGIVECNMYQRTECQILRKRLEGPRRFIQVVMGPRQVAKSTMVRQVLNDLDTPYQLFSADNMPATDFAWVSNCWAMVRRLLDNQGLESITLPLGKTKSRNQSLP